MNLKNINLLVTGGCGFIGSNFCNFICDKVNKLVIIDKITYAGNKDNIKHILNKSNVILIEEDIIYHNFQKTYCDCNINYIVHLAGETHVDKSYSCLKNFIDNNITATHILLESLKINKIPIIFFSTDEIYGESNNNKFLETDHYNPTNPYAATKAAAELLINSYIKSYNINIIIVRCNNVYGLNQHNEKVIPCFIDNAFNNKSLNLHGNGNKIRDFVYVDDIIDAILILMNCGVNQEIYNIGYENPISILELAKIILKECGSDSKIEYIKDRQFNDNRYNINSDKICELGWKPKHITKDSFIINIKKLIKDKYDNN
uniref:dTDP-glucose 4,6 dehydratase n=1 Tax=Virus NIOZ-UU159 TaxID=2763270 RepID=A0A7S9XHR0_9VIRU|nr:MAG: dTDP-glucose 4,6 dehydratase [Virus NIOZ-UU159]